MLFSELYGNYFRAVTAILTEAVRHTLTGEKLNELVREKAFSESVTTIPAALRDDWPLLRDDLTTPLHHTPSMPLTLLEKRWMKALLLDPKIALFAPDTKGLEEIEPLFVPEDLVYFDQYGDGDPYEDPAYIRNFRNCLRAIREQRELRVGYRASGQGVKVTLCLPERIEYSEKDDKFRLLARGKRSGHVFNIGKIAWCQLLDPGDPAAFAKERRHKQTLVFQLEDQRNALDRVLLHFSHFEKETVRLSDHSYQVTLRYDREDETELLIRVLSFGPFIRVTAPEHFVDRIRERLTRQSRLTPPEEP